MGQLIFGRFLLVLAGCILMGNDAYSNSNEYNFTASWAGTKKFKEFIRNSPISVDEGRKIIKKAVVQNKLAPSKYGNVPSGPIFVYDSFMFFSFERKGEIGLKGFYLNVDTGTVEYRWTDDKVYMKTSFFGFNEKISVKYKEIEIFSVEN